MKLAVYEIIAESCVAQGVTTAYTLMTSDNMGLLASLEERGINVMRARTEHGAVCMADGHARATGDVSVVSIGAGPSVGMTGTALVTAQRRRSPVVVIAGDVPTGERQHLKRFDQAGFFQVTAGHCLSVQTTESVVRDTYECFRRSRSGAGPSVLNIPVDLLEGEIDVEKLQDDSRFMARTPEIEPSGPASSTIARAVAMLADSKRPLIIAGRGATDSEALTLMESIGVRVGALFGTSLQAQYLFDDQYSVGIVGTLGVDGGARLVAQADCILAVGASLNAYTNGHGQSFPTARIIHIDQRREVFGSGIPVEVAICSDATVALAAIDEGLAQKGVTQAPGFRSEGVEAELAEDVLRLSRFEQNHGLLDPRFALEMIAEHLPTNRKIVVDAGHFAFFVVDHVRLESPGERIWTADFGSIGLGLAAGIGVSHACPDSHAVVFVGDGAFAMSLCELDTAVRQESPLTVVVVDDEAYGAELRYLENRGVSDHLARFASPDFVAIAKGFGCEARHVRTPDELEEACTLIGTATPLVIDVKVDPSVVNRQFRGRRHSAAGAS